VIGQAAPAYGGGEARGGTAQPGQGCHGVRGPRGAKAGGAGQAGPLLGGCLVPLLTRRPGLWRLDAEPLFYVAKKATGRLDDFRHGWAGVARPELPTRTSLLSAEPGLRPDAWLFDADLAATSGDDESREEVVAGEGASAVREPGVVQHPEELRPLPPPVQAVRLGTRTPSRLARSGMPGQHGLFMPGGPVVWQGCRCPSGRAVVAT